jgi:hypothetical protein
MHEIICPHCNKALKIDEAGYADILKQVRDGAFAQQLHERLELAEHDKRNAVELAQAKVDREIQELKAKLDAVEVACKLVVTEALSAVQKERDALANELQQAKRDRVAAAELAEASLASGLFKGFKLELQSGVAMKPIGQKVVISRCVVRAGLGDTQKYPYKSTTSINRKRLFRAIAMKTSKDLELPAELTRLYWNVGQRLRTEVLKEGRATCAAW